MDSSKRTATAPMPENTPMDELVVDEVVEGDKLKIFVDLYFWFSGHLIELYVLIAECLGFRETPLEGDKKRVRWTCVKTFRNIMFSFEQRLIQLRRFAVAICTMNFTSFRLALPKLYNGIWTIQTRHLSNPYAVQMHLFLVALIHILRLIMLRDPMDMRSILFEGGKMNLPMMSFAIVTSIF